MIRYDNPKTGWVCEIEGAADMPMAAVGELYNTFQSAIGILVRVVKHLEGMVDWDGQPVTLEPTLETTIGETETDEERGIEGYPQEVQTERPPLFNISPRQLSWLRSQVQQAALDEIIDPEA